MHEVDDSSLGDEDGKLGMEGSDTSTSASDEDAGTGEARIHAWRLSIVSIYIDWAGLLVPVITLAWMLARREPLFAPPAPVIIAGSLSFLAARLVRKRRFAVHASVAAIVLTGVACVPLVGFLPGPALVLLTGATLVSMVHGLRYAQLLVAVGTVEYFVCGLNGWYRTIDGDVGPPLAAATIGRISIMFALSCSLLLVALTRLLRRLEAAWLDQQRAAANERRAREELERAEHAAREAERLEALGRLAGGVAHDFNNLLLIILTWTDLLSDPNGDEEQRAEGVASVRQAATQAAALTRRLLTFARKDAWTPVELDVDSAIHSMMESLRRLVPKNVELRHERASLPKVVLDEAALGQILVNLTVNAADAMADGGKLTFSTKLESGPAEGPLSGVETVALRVEDTGTGIDDDTMARLFEPFFTTKEAGKGTGLGLPSVYGIVQQAGGTIDVASEVGKGTVFTLRFAVRSLSDTVEEKKAASVRRVLVVDDDEQIRQVISATLRAEGHEVTTAGSVADGVLAVRRMAGTYDALCTDAVMPGEPTRVLIEAFRERFSRGAIVVCSGYGQAELDRLGLTADVGAFLSKPFVAAELVALVTRRGAPATIKAD